MLTGNKTGPFLNEQIIKQQNTAETLFAYLRHFLSAVAQHREKEEATEKSRFDRQKRKNLSPFFLILFFISALVRLPEQQQEEVTHAFPICSDRTSQRQSGLEEGHHVGDCSLI